MQSAKLTLSHVGSSGLGVLRLGDPTWSMPTDLCTHLPSDAPSCAPVPPPEPGAQPNYEACFPSRASTHLHPCRLHILVGKWVSATTALRLPQKAAGQQRATYTVHCVVGHRTILIFLLLLPFRIQHLEGHCTRYSCGSQYFVFPFFYFQPCCVIPPLKNP